MDMKPNIGKSGRIIRLLCAFVMLAAGFVVVGQSLWIGVLLLVCGGFVLFEALRGWCLLRACGIKTKW